MMKFIYKYIFSCISIIPALIILYKMTRRNLLNTIFNRHFAYVMLVTGTVKLNTKSRESSVVICKPLSIASKLQVLSAPGEDEDDMYEGFNDYNATLDTDVSS